MEYCMSQGNRWCDSCKIFIADNRFSIRTHELGKRHKDNVTKRELMMQKESDAKDKEQQQTSRALQQIEAYWVSQGNKWCDSCKIFIADNPFSIRTHELGKRHKDNVTKRVLTMQEESDAKDKEQQQASRALQQIEAWTPPLQGWYKMNFDASVYNDGSGRASIGGVIRDSSACVVLAFAELTEHSTVGIIEARAMIRGLQLARELGLDRVVAEGDDLVLVQLLRGEEMQTRIPMAMQEEIVELLRCFAACDVQHVYREGNQVAHTLCRQAYHGPGVWEGRMLLPSAVWEKAEEDRHGVLHERTVVCATS